MSGSMTRSVTSSIGFYLSCLAALLCTLTASDGRCADKPASGVVTAIEKKYQVTQLTTDLEQVTKDGTTMAMKCAGVYSLPSNLMFRPDNKVVDGKVQTPGMFQRVTFEKSGSHVLQTGDKVYITKIETKNDGGGDSLRFTIVTVDSLDVKGSDNKKKYAASLSFKFNKGYLDETPPDQVEQVIEGVLAPDSGGDAAPAADEKPAAAPAAPAKVVRTAPVAAAPPPPPPAPAAPAPTITLGESSTEVLQAMGMPLQMADLGKKKIYTYKNMKVIFLNDKVSDIQ